MELQLIHDVDIVLIIKYLSNYYINELECIFFCSTVPSNFPFPGTRQIQNLNYGVCIDVALGYCGIEWSQLDLNSFSISGDSGNIDSAAGEIDNI